MSDNQIAESSVSEKLPYWVDKIKKLPRQTWDAIREHFRKKEIKRRWRGRLIAVLCIAAFIGSLYIKNFATMFPYSSEDFLTVSGSTIMDGSGSSTNGLYRLNQFMQRTAAGIADDIRIITYTSEGYMIKNDLSVDTNGNITLVIDNKKNKLLEKEDRVKQTLTFVSMGTEVERSAWRNYILYTIDGEKHTIFSEELR